MKLMHICLVEENSELKLEENSSEVALDAFIESSDSDLESIPELNALPMGGAEKKTKTSNDLCQPDKSEEKPKLKEVQDKENLPISPVKIALEDEVIVIEDDDEDDVCNHGNNEHIEDCTEQEHISKSDSQVYSGNTYTRDLGLEVESDKAASKSSLPDIVSNNIDYFSCQYCTVAFTQLSYLESHVKYKHGGKFLAERHQDFFHTPSDHSSQPSNQNQPKLIQMKTRPHQCKMCKKYFKQHRHLKDHLRIHKGEKPHKSDKSNKSFRYHQSLNFHYSFHNQEKLHKCDKCCKSFMQFYNLKKHQRNHTGEKPYKCDRCGKSFAQYNVMKSHTRIHTREKPYKCYICSKRFIQLEHFKSHQLIHIRKKPYQCDKCNKVFTLKQVFKRHQNIHMEKTYQCDKCKNHQHKILSGEKPFKCDQCDSFFAEKTDMTKHHQRVPVVEKCNKTGFTAESSELDLQEKKNKEVLDILSVSGVPGPEWSSALVAVPEGMVAENSESELQEKKSKVELDYFSASYESDPEWPPVLDGGEKRKAKISSVLCQPEKSKENSKLMEVQVIKNLHCFSPTNTPDKVTTHIEDDEYIFCEECNIDYIGDCTVHGPLNIISDAQVPADCIRSKNADYCRKTLPPGLVIKTSDIPDAGLGVFATTFFPARTRFGPYIGKNKSIEQCHDSKYCWQIMKNGRPSYCVDGGDSSDSNWMRFINCARFEDEQCVTAYQHQGEIFYRAHRDIPAGTEILVYYGDSYARELGIEVDRANAVSKNSLLKNMSNKNGLVAGSSEMEIQEMTCKSMLDFFSTSDDSDPDWTPALEGGEKRKARISSFLCQLEKSKENSKLMEVQDIDSLQCSSPTNALEKVATHIEDDEYLFCEECNIEYIGDCTVHGPLNIISDSQVPPDCIRGKDKDYCRKTLPPGLVIKTSDIPDAGLGVFATTFFPARTRFGPYVGKNKIVEQMAHNCEYCWQISKDGKPSHCVDGGDSSDSNWMRFINCARFEDEQCVTAYQHQGEIFYRAHRDIPAGTEILVYYGDRYARDLGIQAERANAASVNSLPNICNNMNVSEYNFCEQCNCEDIEICTEHGPIIVVSDSQVPPDCIRGKDKDYCRKTLPPGLVIKTSDIPDAGLGVFATTFFPARTRFGPYVGKNKSIEQLAHDSKYCWQIFKDGSPSHCIDGSDSSDSNWMRFINLARFEDEQCVTAYQHQGEIFYRAHRDIPAGTEILGLSSLTIGGFIKDGLTIGGFTTVSLTIGGFTKDGLTIGGFTIDALTVYFSDNYARDLGIQVSKNTLRNTEKNKNDFFPCQYCSLAFSQHSFLDIHIKYKHEEEMKARPHKCETCNKCFKHPCDLKEHEQIHTDEEALKCDKCSRGFKYLCQLKMHLNFHSGIGIHKCDKCGKCFKYFFELKKHQSKHTRERPHKCDKCNKSFEKLCHLKKHKNVHTEENTHKCEICNKYRKHIQYLPDHNKLHSKHFRYCGKIGYHRKVHNGEKSYKCNVCSECFTSYSAVQKHQRIHSKLPYKCDQCDRVFRRIDNLKRHQETHNKGSYMCDKCGQLFTQEKGLKEHDQRIHSGEKFDERDYIADNSESEVEKNRSEAMPESLSASGNPDSKLTPPVEVTPQDCFACQYCTVAFTQLSYLKRHLKYKHGGEILATRDDHSISITSEHSLQSSNLNQLNIIHIEALPHKSFTKESSLKKHNDIMHSGEKFDERGFMAENSDSNLQEQRSETMSESSPFSGGPDLTSAKPTTPQGRDCCF
ncbi:uncharacterized protein LOC131947800 [Physella acuta]|uniref:uncharacterized protein LOC131947800 n=1 Tax=Physella acuta TaxID=109671 RepID=UPI0027DD5127|nr:uncharacterized protein LOC131947800 [Physella acuta]